MSYFKKNFSLTWRIFVKPLLSNCIFTAIKTSGQKCCFSQKSYQNYDGFYSNNSDASQLSTVRSVEIRRNDLGVMHFEGKVVVKSRNRKIEYCTLIILYLNVLTLVYTKHELTKNTAIKIYTLHPQFIQNYTSGRVANCSGPNPEPPGLFAPKPYVMLH